MGITEAVIAGLALSAAGAGYSMNSASEAQNEMKKRVEEQLANQKNIQQKSTPLYEANVEQSSQKSLQQKQQAGAEQAQALYNQVQGAPAVAAQQLGSMPVALGAQNKASGEAQARQYSKLLEAPAAQMQGLNQANVEQGIANRLTNAQLGVNNYLSGMSASTMPYLLNAAQMQAQQGQAIGGLMGSAGGALAAYGASNSSGNGGWGQGETLGGGSSNVFMQSEGAGDSFSGPISYRRYQ